MLVCGERAEVKDRLKKQRGKRERAIKIQDTTDTVNREKEQKVG